jgi:predicted regulator of Ras-like GTPase activity (Roadblock/LC7/MglB family)
VKKKKEFQETTTTMIIENGSSSPAEDAQEITRLCVALAEIGKSPGVIGYILRNESSATVGLMDSANLANYALLSSEAFDFCEELLDLFTLGEAESMLMEGKNAKVLFLLMGKNMVSIFMEKNADDTEILNKVTAEPAGLNP